MAKTTTTIDVRHFLVLFRNQFSLIFRSRVARAGGIILVAVVLFVEIGSYTTPYSPTATSTLYYSPPSLAHPFGTDNLGHDLLSQVVWGAQSTLSVSLLVGFVATFVGFIAGIYAGYYEKLEAIIGGATDMVMSFPALPLLILITAVFYGNPQVIPLSLMVVFWAPVSRAVRAQTSALKKLAFVESSKLSGFGDTRIIWRIMIFLVAPIGIAYFIINIGLAIVILTALEFLGVGNPLVVTWGSILYWAQIYAFVGSAWWWILFPGLFITLTTVSLALIGYSFEEVANPRLRT